jgi:hypothetical protein
MISISSSYFEKMDPFHGRATDAAAVVGKPFSSTISNTDLSLAQFIAALHWSQ